MTIKDAIEQSVSKNEIVRFVGNKTDYNYLISVADGYVEGVSIGYDDGTDSWGIDESGEEWRILFVFAKSE